MKCRHTLYVKMSSHTRHVFSRYQAVRVSHFLFCFLTGAPVVSFPLPLPLPLLPAVGATPHSATTAVARAAGHADLGLTMCGMPGPWTPQLACHTTSWCCHKEANNMADINSVSRMMRQMLPVDSCQQRLQSATASRVRSTQKPHVPGKK